MSDARLLFSDMDRTLLTHHYELPDRVAAAIGRVRGAGLDIVLTSGRSPAGLLPYAERLGLTSLAICFNGAWIGDLATGAVLHRQSVEREAALQVVSQASALGLAPIWFSDGQLYGYGDIETAKREAAITNEPLNVVERLAELPGEPDKIMCVHPHPEDGEAFLRLRALFGATLTVSSSHTRLLEVSPPGVSKGAAVAFVAEHLAIDRDNCVAAGDAENDLEMVRWAPLVITVDNAIAPIREIAAFTGPSCDEGGMADSLDWLLASRLSTAAA